MKKTIITAMLALGLAASASAAESVNLSATPNGTVISGFYTIAGFTMDFSNNAAYTINGVDATRDDISALTNIQLTTVTVSFDNATGSDISLAVYEVTSTADSSVDNWTLSFKAESTNAGPTSANADHTFNFDSLTLDPNKVYAFFYTANSVDDSVVSAFTTVSEARVKCNSKKTHVMLTGDGLSYTLANAQSGGLTAGDNVTALATFNFTATNAVPEPATATLSLLALAGLAARRRRK